MKTLCSEIVVAAPPERVWEVLVDLARYPDWNPFLVAASGLLVPLLARSLDRHTAQGFVAMNEALKARVEQAVAGPTP